MEIETSCSEITKHICLNNFSTYTDVKDKITQSFTLTLENFYSEWEVNIIPMKSVNSIDWKPIHCDVYVELICLFSTAPPNDVKTVQIASFVKGRENYPKAFDLIQHCDEKPMWKCAIISQVTLESLKIIKDDQLEFFIQFNFTKEILHKSEDGRNTIVKNIEAILKDPVYCDTCLVSSSDTKFYVHSSILHSRSNIMKTGRVLTLSHYHEYHEDSLHTLDEEVSSESKSLIKSLDEDSSATSSLHTSSLENKSESSSIRTPLFTVASNMSSPRKCLAQRTQSPSSFTPKKSLLSSMTPIKKCDSPVSSLTPKKKFDSPSRSSNQTQLTNYFPRSSSLTTKSEEASLSNFLTFSPIKTPSKLSYNGKSPMIKSSQENGKKTPSKQSLISLSVNSDIRSPFGIIPKQNVQNLKRKLFEHQIEENRNITVLKLNMSTSVLQEMLMWIYSGKSSRLSELSRPLLVAALRHNINDLARAAQFYLASILAVNNVAELLHLSRKYEANILKEEALLFAVSNASEVTNTSTWADLSVRYPDVLLDFTRRLAATIRG